MTSWDAFKAGLTCIYDSNRDSSGLRPAEALSYATESNVFALVHATETCNTGQDIPLMQQNADGFYFKDFHFDRNIDVVEKIVVRGVAKASLLIGTNDEFPLVPADYQRTHFVFKHRVTVLLGALKARDAIGNKHVRIRCYFHSLEYREFTLSYDAILLHTEPRHTLATREKWLTHTHIYENGVAWPVVIEDRDPVRLDGSDASTASWYSGLPAGTSKAPSETKEAGPSESSEAAPDPCTDLMAVLAALSAKFDALETKLDTRLTRIEAKVDDMADEVDNLKELLHDSEGGEEDDEDEYSADAEETFRRLLGEANKRAEDADAVRVEKGNEDEEKVLDSGYLYNHRFRIQGVRVDE